MIEEINILGMRYHVNEVDVVNKMEPRSGELDYLTGEIRVDRNMSEDMKEQTLMHEILHATFDLLGMDDLAENEERVQSLATALHQIFKAQTIFKSDF